MAERALQTLGWDVEIVSRLAGAASGSHVYRVRVDGRDAVLKLTTAGPGQRDARRELAFYQTLAGQVPVATPRLLRYADTSDLTALLLSAHSPSRPAREWDHSAWLEVARQMAALHSTPVPHTGPWRRTPWLQRVLAEPPTDVATRYWSGTAAVDRLGPLVDGRARLAEALRTTSDCFIHGDCHVDNLLRDGDSFVWTDWQVTGAGHPAIDLAFLWHRATCDGATPPCDAMLDEYANYRGVDPTSLRRSVQAAELGYLLFGWPHYAALRDQDARDHATRRLLELTTDWL